MEQASTTIHFKRECAQCGRDVIGVAIEEGRAKISGSSVDASIFRIQGRFKTVYSDWFCSRECAETYVRNYKGFVLASDVVAEQKKDVDEDDDEAEDEQEEFEDDEDSEDEENQIDNTPQFSEEELEENRRKAEFIRKAEEIKLADTSPDSIIEWYKNYAFKSNTVAQSIQELRSEYLSVFNHDSVLNDFLESAFGFQIENIVKYRISSILDKHNSNGLHVAFFLSLPFMMSFEDNRRAEKNYHLATEQLLLSTLQGGIR